MERHEFRYYAFISYSRKDEKWAKWLQKRLETYRLPAIIRKENDSVPQHIRPVFRDKTDIGVGKIAETLKNELEESRNLIVICSPNSAKSEWVNREVEYYKELGREDRIIPLIIKGTPDSKTPENKCYPPALSEDFLGSSIEELGEDKAFVKVVASMLQLKFDQLWNRHHRMRERKKLVKRLVLAFSFVALLATGYFLWDYYAPHEVYYSDYVERYGIPEGIRELSSEEFSHREGSYRFIYRKGLLRRLTRVNSAGMLREHHDSEHMEHPNDMKLYYTLENTLDYADYLNRNGKILFRKDYNPKLNAVTFRHADEYNTEFSLSGRTTQTFNYSFATNKSNKGQITRHLITYDDDGFVSRIEYAKYQNNPATDADGIHGHIYKRDEKGRTVEVQYFGINGKPKNNKVGLGMKRYGYNENDDWVFVSYHNKNGQLSHDDIGISSCKLFYDKWGNRIKELYYDQNDQPIYRRDMFIAGMEYEFSDSGFLTKVSYVGLDGKNCISIYGNAYITSSFDENGNETLRSLFNLEDEPVLSNEGNAKLEMKYNEVGNVTEAWYYGINDSLCFNKNGIAGETYSYDSLGNMVKYRTYGIDKKLCLKVDQIAGYNAKFDDRSNLIEMVNIGADNQPTSGNTIYTSWRAVFDNRGNQTEVSYHDSIGNLCFSTDDIAGWKSVYDDMGNETERNYFCLQTEACRGNISYAGWKAKYDDQGNELELIYHDENNRPVVSKDGYSGWRSSFDERGNNVETVYLNEMLEPTKDFLISRQAFDENDNEIQKLYFNEKRQPAYTVGGYAGWKAEFDERNNLTKKIFLDTAQNPVICDYGYASYISKYDSRNNEIEISYFGKTGEPVLNTSKVHRTVKEYDAVGNMVYEANFGINGEEVLDYSAIHAKRKKYDQFGREINITAYGLNGSFVPYENGCVQKRYEYDNFGNILKVSYHDENGDLKVCSQGFAVMKNKINHRSQILEQQFFDASGNPVLYEGYHRYQRIFDKKGNITDVFYYGLDNQLRKDAYAHEKQTFDAAGRLVKGLYFDHNEKPCNYSTEWAFTKILFKYNTAGKLAFKEYYKLNGELLAMLDGNNKRVYTKAEICDYIRSITVPQVIVTGLEFVGRQCDGRNAMYHWKLQEWVLSTMSDQQIQEVKESIHQIALSYNYVTDLLSIQSKVSLKITDAEGADFAVMNL